MNAPVNILHVFPGFAVGGAQMRLVALVQGLGAEFSHTIMSLNGDNGAARFLAPGEVSLAAAPSASGSLVARLGRYRKALRERRPDLLVTYNWGAIEWALANGAVEHSAHPYRRRFRIRRKASANFPAASGRAVWRFAAAGWWFPPGPWKRWRSRSGI